MGIFPKEIGMKPKRYVEYCLAEVRGIPWYAAMAYMLVLLIIGFVVGSSSFFMLSSGNALTALAGAFFIVCLGVLLIIPPVAVTSLASSLYQPDHDNYVRRTSQARRLVMEPLAKEIMEALKAGRNPKAQFRQFVELAIATGYPLDNLDAKFYDLQYKYPAVKRPKFTLFPSVDYVFSVHCTYQPFSATEDVEVEVSLTAS